MSTVDVKVSSGHLDVNKEKNLLVWVLGTSLPYAAGLRLEEAVSLENQPSLTITSLSPVT